MADAKISGLADGAPAVATDQLPIARAGTTKRLTLADLQALASVTSTEVSAVSAAAAVAVNVVSNALSNEISARTSAVNVVSNALSNEISVRVSAVNAVSNAASNALSVANAASNAASVVSTAASNALSVANAASNAASIVSQALSVETAARVAGVNTVSNAVSDLLSAHNVLSNRVSANSATAGVGSVTSAELVAGDNAVSAQAASADSVLRGTVRILADAFTVSTASALIDVSGMSAPVVAGGLYRLDGIWMGRYFSAGQVLSVGYGLTFPAMTGAVGRVAMQLSATAAGAPIGMTSAQMAHGYFDEGATGSTIVIGLPGASANLSRNMMVVWEGLFNCAGSGSIQLQARCGSAGTNAPVIQPGSYMRVVRLG